MKTKDRLISKLLDDDDKDIRNSSNSALLLNYRKSQDGSIQGDKTTASMKLKSELDLAYKILS